MKRLLPLGLVLLVAMACGPGGTATTPTAAPAQTTSSSSSARTARSPAPVASPSGRVLAGGVIRTVAGDGSPNVLNNPTGIALDSAGNLFIADIAANSVFKVPAGGGLARIAGTGTSGFSGDGGPAISAQLAGPSAVAVDGAGNLYIADTSNNRVRKVTATGTISTVAGTGVGGLGGDNGPATAANLAGPAGVAVDASGTLYIADTLDELIRTVALDGTITTFAGLPGSGSSGDGGPATAAHFWYPTQIAFDASGALYIADSVNNKVRKVAGGIVTLVAGNGTAGYGGDGGPATSASLSRPVGVAAFGGALYISESINDRVRKVAADGTISTVVGTGSTAIVGDNGAAAAATLSNPGAILVDRAGNLYIADTGHRRVREVGAPV